MFKTNAYVSSLSNLAVVFVMEKSRALISTDAPAETERFYPSYFTACAKLIENIWTW